MLLKATKVVVRAHPDAKDLIEATKGENLCRFGHDNRFIFGPPLRARVSDILLANSRRRTLDSPATDCQNSFPVLTFSELDAFPSSFAIAALGYQTVEGMADAF
jgi:hypothetical protein